MTSRLFAHGHRRDERVQEIDLSAGMIEYEDTGGSDPVVVLLHGLAMDGSVWRHVVRELRADHRCVIPTLPLGSHRQPMRADADLSPHGIARLQAEFLEALDLREVTLVGNDTSHFQFTAGLYPEHIARLVLTPCEAFENFPPGLPGRTAEIGIKMPGGTFIVREDAAFGAQLAQTLDGRRNSGVARSAWQPGAILLDVDAKAPGR